MARREIPLLEAKGGGFLHPVARGEVPLLVARGGGSPRLLARGPFTRAVVMGGFRSLLLFVSASPGFSLLHKRYG